MEAFNIPSGPNKPLHSGIGFSEASSTPRVRSHPQTTTSTKKSHLPSLHQHRHHHHHHHHHSRHVKSSVQNAVQIRAPASFGDLLKQTSRSSHNSSPHSRGETAAVTTPEHIDEHKAGPAQKLVRPDDVSRERAMVKARERELRAALQKLSEQSLKTSRRLDDTYYSILERVSSLRQTIANLQELCGLTKELHETFQLDTQELAEDAQSQFEGFNNFITQQEQVSALEDRMRAGKDKADALTTRLEEARKKVEARGKLEAEWEARTSRRLRILWGILGSIAGLILVAILFQQLKPIPLPSHNNSVGFDLKGEILNAPISDTAKEALRESSTAIQNAQRGTPAVEPVTDSKDNDRIRVVDEL